MGAVEVSNEDRTFGWEESAAAGQQQAAWVGTTLNSFFTQVFAASGSLCPYTLQVPSSCSWSELSCQLLRQAFADILSETPPGCWLDQELQRLGICASGTAGAYQPY